MKNIYFSQIPSLTEGTQVDLYGWCKNIRKHKNIIFIDLVDSTATVETVLNKDKKGDLFLIASQLKEEASVKMIGIVKFLNNKLQVVINNILLLGDVNLDLSPKPRQDFSILEKKYNNKIMNHRHIYIRNPVFLNILKFKSLVLKAFRSFFENERFVEVDMPILTKTGLYSENIAFSLDVHDEKIFLSQCAGLYLEAVLHGLEKVYTVAPSFRAEKSKSPRHNIEFWHIKEQVAFYNLSDMKKFIESMVFYVVSFLKKSATDELNFFQINLNLDQLKPPYPEITYDEAIGILETNNIIIPWGNSLNPKAEEFLSKKFDTPFFVTKMPRKVEPFPYDNDENNSEVTKTADLLLPDGFGELLGVAEFVNNINTLKNKMGEKNKNPESDGYKWYCELKEYGHVPHSGFGLGVERMVRWLLKLDHVKNSFAFPRVFGRKIYP